MVHATSVTATTGVLSHPADSAVSHGHVTSHTSSLSQPCYLRTPEHTLRHLLVLAQSGQRQGAPQRTLRGRSLWLALTE